MRANFHLIRQYRLWLLSPALLAASFSPFVSKAQTWVTVWGENFNNKTYESCYATGGDTYWGNCNSPSSGPRNSLVNGAWEVSNTALGSTQSPSNASGGRFLMYWSDNSYNGGAAVPAGDNVIFRETLTGLVTGRKYRISYKIGGLLQQPATNILSPASIGLKLNGTTVISPVTTITSWVSQTYTWTATGTSMALEWTNTSKAVNGNDFALDDLLVEVFSNPLPVTLSSFTAVQGAGCTTLMQWATAEEKDFNYFETERSTDGAGFETIDRVPAKGMAAIYTSTDQHPVPGKNIYRLKMVDKDGSYQYSSAAVVNSECGATGSVHVYPVPAHDKVYVSGAAGGELLVLYDATGRAVYRKELQGGEAVIDAGALPRGLYILRVQSTTGYTAQLVLE